MLTEYVEEALRRARYELIEDQEPYYGEVPELKGVWATGKTLEECRENLKDVIEGWILVSLKRDMPVPRLGRREIVSRIMENGKNIFDNNRKLGLESAPASATTSIIYRLSLPA
jgi:predicted RNase H-like HicB family nuclease